VLTPEVAERFRRHAPGQDLQRLDDARTGPVEVDRLREDASSRRSDRVAIRTAPIPRPHTPGVASLWSSPGSFRTASGKFSPSLAPAAQAVGVVMGSPRDSNGALWMVAGTVALMAGLLLVLHLNQDQDPAARLAARAKRIDLVQQMETDLASASEAEKTAVLALTDQDSQAFADQSRAASARVDEERRDLESLLATGGAPPEKELLARFTTAFGEFRRVDDELLALAVKNTNVKAYRLAYGPAATALDEVNAALSRVIASNGSSSDAKTILSLAFGAETNALRIATLLPPHIAEENDKRMDELEASMGAQDAEVRKDLEGLAALPRLARDPDLATARARYAELGKLRTQILVLSRENTNLRSSSISLSRKREVTRTCEDALRSLRQAIEAEPVDRGMPVRPR
jgi:hypothetical protein